MGPARAERARETAEDGRQVGKGKDKGQGIGTVLGGNRGLPTAEDGPAAASSMPAAGWLVNPWMMYKLVHAVARWFPDRRPPAQFPSRASGLCNRVSTAAVTTVPTPARVPLFRSTQPFHPIVMGVYRRVCIAPVYGVAAQYVSVCSQPVASLSFFWAFVGRGASHPSRCASHQASGTARRWGRPAHVPPLSANNVGR